MCLTSDALLQHLPFYLGFSYLGCGVSLHSCSSKAQPLLLVLDEGYLLTATIPDLQRGIAPLGPPAPAQPLLLTLDEGYLLTTALPDLQRGMAPLGPPAPAQPPLLGLLLPAAAPGVGCRPWPPSLGDSSRPPPLASGEGWILSVAAPDLGRGVSPSGRTDLKRGVALLGHRPWPGMGGSSSAALSAPG